MASITSANAVYMIGITNLYTTAQQIQGFDVDDAFMTEAIDAAELKMGVDGTLSAGFVYTPFPQTITLQADSSSNSLFDAWYAAEKAAVEKYTAFGLISLSGVNRKFTLTRGFLTNYVAVPEAKRVLQPRKFGITWESIVAVSL